MKKLLYTLLAVSIIFSACEEEVPMPANNNNANNVTELEGTWLGDEVYAPGNILNQWVVIVSGNEMEYSGTSDSTEWYAGTYSINNQVNPKQYDLLITDCTNSSYIGTTAKGIYKIENDTTFTSSNCEPGSLDRPSSFFDNNVLSRSFILTKQ
jgi:uncharacterized protein (TIGR03067 family)